MPALKRINSNVDVPSCKLAGREGRGQHAKTTSPPIDVPQHMLDHVRGKVRVRLAERSTETVPEASGEVDLFDFDDTENLDSSYAPASSKPPCTPTQMAHMVGRLQTLSNPSTSMEIEVARHVRWVAENAHDAQASSAGVCEVVAASLAGGGFSARMVQSKSDSADYLRSMNHMFVMVHPRGARGHEQPLVVDPDFRNQFHIARPTPEYEQLLSLLPNEFVGTRDRLAEVVDFMSKRLHESFKCRDMACPPWRERQALLSKWFGGLITQTVGAPVEQRQGGGGEVARMEVRQVA